MTAPGQKARDDFPRFGLPQYASRFPSDCQHPIIHIDVNAKEVMAIDLSSSELSRSTITADFHCVTTWSHMNIEWSGIRFSDLFKHLVEKNQVKNLAGAILKAQDGYKTSLILEDLLGDNVLLADTLNGQPLSIEHGAPVRLIAPNHYGYKNLKHLSRIQLYTDLPIIKRGYRAFLDHPRARVAKEERGRWIPGWILRYIYRLMIPHTVKTFERAMDFYKGGSI